jgi:hypothetical protein
MACPIYAADELNLRLNSITQRLTLALQLIPIQKAKATQARLVRMRAVVRPAEIWPLSENSVGQNLLLCQRTSYCHMQCLAFNCQGSRHVHKKYGSINKFSS